MTLKRILIGGCVIALLALTVGWLLSDGNGTNSTAAAKSDTSSTPSENTIAENASNVAKVAQDNTLVGSRGDSTHKTGENEENDRVVLQHREPVEKLIEKADKAVPRGITRFAEAVAVKLNPENSGKWEDLGEVQKWRLRIQSPDAISLNLGFSKYVMPRGGQLKIFAPENEANPTYRAFTEADNEAHQQLWTPIIRGDEVVIEAIIPTGSINDLQLELAQVSHGFRGFRPKAASKGTKIGGDASGSCNIDVVCDDTTLPGGVGALIDGMRDQIRSVGAFTLEGIDACSGTLITNMNNDLVPYFLTANHCGITSGNAPSMVVYWNFENSTCRTPGGASSGQVGDGDLSQFNSGAIFRAAHADSDFCLVELDDNPDPTYDLYYAGWDRTTDDPTMATGIHHPTVAEKRISFDLDPSTTTEVESNAVTPGAPYIRITDWDHGTTEGGSSGSALFNENGRLVGQLFGGDAECGNNLSDWYGRFSSSWDGGGTSDTQLSSWLDPSSTGSLISDGVNQDDVINIDDVSISEGNSGNVSAVLTVSLHRTSNDTILVNWGTFDDGATLANNDFVLDSGTLTFLPAETTKTITVQVKGDVAQEDNETFNVVLSNPTSAQLGNAIGVVTILNDDFYDPPVITSSATAVGTQDLLFTYQIDATNSPTGYGFASAPPAGMTVNSTGLVSWTPSAFGTFQFEVRATSAAGMGDQIVTVEIAENSLGNALDNSVIPLSTSGAQPWELQTAVTKDGEDAAASGIITDNQESIIEFSVTGPDYLIFDWKVSSEKGYDFLQLRKTGVTVMEISGDVDWTHRSVKVPAGQNTYRFRYIKDSSEFEGGDRGYVDQLFLASSKPSPVITSADAGQAIQNVAYSYQIETAQIATSFNATGLPDGLTINTTSGLISGAATEAGDFSISLSATNGSGTELATLQLSIAAELPGMPAAVGSNLSWSTGGSANWFIQNSVSRDGQAVQSGSTGNLGTSSLFTTVPGPSDFVFYWKVSSEPNFDKLRFFVDNVEVSSINGEVNWTRKNMVLGTGNHLVEIRYTKDVSNTSGSDAGWIDSVEVIPLPSAVPGITATDGTFTNFVTISWTAPSEPVTKYSIYRATSNNSGLAVKIGENTNTSFGDATAVRGTQYYYFVRAENSAGIGPFGSSDAGYSRPDLPSASSQITATDGTFSDRVDVVWNLASGVVDEYRLYRSADTNSPGDLLATLTGGILNYSDTSAIPGEHYYYSVAAYNLAGEGPVSQNDLGARKLPAPTGVTASSNNADQISLSWNTAAYPVDLYRIYRNPLGNSLANASLIATVDGTSNTFIQGEVNPGIGYYYWVTAVSNLTGESSFPSAVLGRRLYITPSGIVEPDTSTAAPNAANALYNADAKGTFTGLINDASASGSEIKLLGKAAISISHSTKTNSGALSGTFSFQGKTYKLKAPFLADGSATIGFVKQDFLKTPLTLTVQLVDSDNGYKLSGSITGDGEVGVLDLYKLIFNKKLNPSPDAGRYTLVLPHETAGDHALVPGGDGVAVASIDADGRIKIAGVLGDGTKHSVSSHLSADGEAATYQGIYSKASAGWIGGMLRFANQDNISSADGILQWFKGTDATQVRYSSGFDLQQGAVISPFTPPNTKAQEFLLSELRDGKGNAIFYLTGGDLNYEIGALSVTWDRKNRILLDSKISKESLIPKVTSTNGLVTGSYVDKEYGVTAKFYGVVFQEQDRVVGHFLGTGQTGYFHISPNGAPDLKVTRATTSTPVLNGDSFDFGDTGFDGGLGEIGFYIENVGSGSLHFRTTPILISSSTEDFSVSFSNSGFIPPGERTLIRVRFQPQEAGAETATLQILTNDEMDNPFNILITGNAIVGTGGLGKETLPSSSATSPTDSLDLTSSSATIYDVTQNGTFVGLITKNESGKPVVGLASLKMGFNKTTGFGVLSGTITLGKSRLSLKGEIIGDGSFTGDFLSSAAPIWTPSIQVQETTGGAVQIVGILTNESSGETYRFVAIPNRFNAKTNPALMAGRFTTALPATAEVYQVYPGGHGYGAFSVSTAGTTKIALVLGDGSKATLSGIISEDGQSQLYAPTLNGIITFRDVPGISDVDGELSWSVSANTKASRYSKGFVGPVTFVGSAYTKPSSGWLLPSIENTLGAGFVSLEGLDLSESMSVTWTQLNKITYTPTGNERLSVAVNSTTGLVSGYWWDRDSGRPKLTFGGVVHQKQDGVFGTIINGLTTGRLEISD